MVLFAQMFAAANKTVTPWLTELGSYAVGPCNLKKKGALRSDLTAPVVAGACNRPNLLVLSFRMELIRLAA